MKFYRYEVIRGISTHEGYPIPYPKLILNILHLIKETDKGYWIASSTSKFLQDLDKKWVSKTSRKRYAYPTKAEALHNCLKRWEFRKRLIKHQLENAETVIQLIKNQSL